MHMVGVLNSELWVLVLMPPAPGIDGAPIVYVLHGLKQWEYVSYSLCKCLSLDIRFFGIQPFLNPYMILLLENFSKL